MATPAKGTSGAAGAPGDNTPTPLCEADAAVTTVLRRAPKSPWSCTTGSLAKGATLVADVASGDGADREGNADEGTLGALVPEACAAARVPAGVAAPHVAAAGVDAALVVVMPVEALGVAAEDAGVASSDVGDVGVTVGTIGSGTTADTSMGAIGLPGRGALEGRRWGAAVGCSGSSTTAIWASAPILSIKLLMG